MRPHETIELAHDGIIVETARARLYDLGDKEAWIPISLIAEEDPTTVTVPEWFAIKEDLI